MSASRQRVYVIGERVAPFVDRCLQADVEFFILLFHVVYRALVRFLERLDLRQRRLVDACSESLASLLPFLGLRIVADLPRHYVVGRGNAELLIRLGRWWAAIGAGMRRRLGLLGLGRRWCRRRRLGRIRLARRRAGV